MDCSMAELKIPRAHSDDWYDNLAAVQTGYYYPWTSQIAANNGEKAFIDLVMQNLSKDTSVLEVACGHGELALSLAPHCKQITAYDRVPGYIDLAKQALAKTEIKNVEYLCYNANDGSEIHLPAEDNSIDLIIGRRAPMHWIADAKRVCRPGAKLIALCPMEEPIPAWSSKLPPKLHYENSGRHTGSGSIHQSVSNRLHQAGLTLHSGWGFDVPETFADAKELYTMITWGLPLAEVPTFDDLSHKLDNIYETYADSQGITLRHCRYLWQADIPG